MVTNPWGIAGLALALFLIYCLISMVNERRKIPTQDQASPTELPPDHPNCRCVLPRETDWFDAEQFVPGSCGLYKALSISGFRRLPSGRVVSVDNHRRMLFWDGLHWRTEEGHIVFDTNFAFRGLIEKVT